MHPSDIWQQRSNVRKGVIFATPRTEGERVEIAESCVRTLGIRFPALIDGMDNAVEREYAGWPDRLIVDRHRRAARVQDRSRSVRLQTSSVGRRAGKTVALKAIAFGCRA
jgi:hypothetical protein